MNTKILALGFLAVICFGQTLLYCDPIGSSIDDPVMPPAKQQVQQSRAATNAAPASPYHVRKINHDHY